MHNTTKNTKEWSWRFPTATPVRFDTCVCGNVQQVRRSRGDVDRCRRCSRVRMDAVQGPVWAKVNGPGS